MGTTTRSHRAGQADATPTAPLFDPGRVARGRTNPGQAPSRGRPRLVARARTPHMGWSGRRQAVGAPGAAAGRWAFGRANPYIAAPNTPPACLLYTSPSPR